MQWYWIVLIVVAALALLEVGAGLYMFFYAFGANRGSVRKLFRQREQDPAPLVRMRFDTKAYMDALPHDNLTQTAPDGVKLAARFFPNNGTKNVAVICHGWHSYPWWDFGKAFDIVYNAGYAVLAVRQRPQGDSVGRYMTYGAKESDDLLGWIRILIKTYGEDLRIAIMGVSMGGATVLCATGKPLPKQVQCAVSDCAFTSAKDQFRSAMKGRFPVARALGKPIARIFAKIRYADAAPIRLRRAGKGVLGLAGRAPCRGCDDESGRVCGARDPLASKVPVTHLRRMDAGRNARPAFFNTPSGSGCCRCSRSARSRARRRSRRRRGACERLRSSGC